MVIQKKIKIEKSSLKKIEATQSEINIYIFKTYEIQRKKFNLGFLQVKSDHFVFTFFYFPFFSVSPNLANIRVDFAQFFFIFLFYVLFGKYVIYCKKIKFLSFT